MGSDPSGNIPVISNPRSKGSPSGPPCCGFQDKARPAGVCGNANARSAQPASGRVLAGSLPAVLQAHRGFSLLDERGSPWFPWLMVLGLAEAAVQAGAHGDAGSACRSGGQPGSERPLHRGTVRSRRWITPAAGLSWALWGVGQHPWPLPTRGLPRPSSWETTKHVSRHCYPGVGATVTPGCDPASGQQGQKRDSSYMCGGPCVSHA